MQATEISSHGNRCNRTLFNGVFIMRLRSLKESFFRSSPSLPAHLPQDTNTQSLSRFQNFANSEGASTKSNNEPPFAPHQQQLLPALTDEAMIGACPAVACHFDINLCHWCVDAFLYKKYFH